MTIEDTFKTLSDYLVYLYPGLIFYSLYSYFNGKKGTDDKTTVIKSICFGFLLVQILRTVDLFDDNNKSMFGIFSHIVLICISIILSYLVYILPRKTFFDKIKHIFKISTNIRNNPFEIISGYDNKTGQYVKIYYDDIKIYYEGALRNYSKETEKMDYYIISGYNIKTISYDNNSTEETIISYENDHSKYAYLKSEKVSRIEVENCD